MARSFWIAVAAAAVSVRLVCGQGNSAEPPRFDVASVKPNRALEGRVGISTPPGGRFEAVNVSLRMLIRFAYEVQDSQLVNTPAWADSERFDILAKGDVNDAPVAPGAIGPIQLMLQSLLADRFRLAVHREKRERCHRDRPRRASG